MGSEHLPLDRESLVAQNWGALSNPLSSSAMSFIKVFLCDAFFYCDKKCITTSNCRYQGGQHGPVAAQLVEVHAVLQNHGMQQRERKRGMLCSAGF